MRLHHYSIHTERSYLDWIERYVAFQHMRSRADLANAEAKIEAFLIDLAVTGDESCMRKIWPRAMARSGFQLSRRGPRMPTEGNETKGW
jgi:integrase-like protein